MTYDKKVVYPKLLSYCIGLAVQRIPYAIAQFRMADGSVHSQFVRI